MDRRKTGNELVNPNTFEYSYPICDDGDESGGDSSKSTPYYTPLEFCQSAFEFPSPTPTEKSVTPVSQVKQESYLESAVGLHQETMDVVRSPAQARQLGQSGVKQGPSVTSPAVSRKLRRFSLYERRSCSPQHLLTKTTAGSVDLTATELPSPVDDKENAKPPQFFDQAREEMVQAITRSGNNSPIILNECGSPKIATSDGVSRHNFSPKLLASINNLKLASSPLGVISSAGYKNGNYFKFPDIDNVVQDHIAGIETTQETASQICDSQIRCLSKQGNVATIPGKSRFMSSNLDSGQAVLDVSASVESACSKENLLKLSTSSRCLVGNKNESGRKSRKNKTDLMIQITDMPVAPSPSAKPKTPTIKSTKEKALSLDSAPCETSLPIVIQSGESQTHGSCDEIDSKMNFSINNSGNNSQLRQRNVGSRDRLRPSISSSSSKPSVCSSASSPAVYRTPHKPSPLLHSSNTNLKTLPEFVTLVEFSTSSPKDRELCPFKQKSMDLPSSSATSTTPIIRAKSSVSSGNLLQRRGSNHSLTLNLHGSCGNLLGSCRGLSVSNYSLGSAATSATSTTNLNLKSNCTPDPPRMLNLRQASKSTATTLQPSPQLTSQGAKQSLFRRRGSNQSLALKNSATSCGNLNALASQNSLNVERGHMHIPGVTRTTSFVTPTHNNNNKCPSSATTPKRGLLERRGSNQSLSLNMSSSFGGMGADRNAYLCDDAFPRRTDKLEPTKVLLPQYCAQHHRKFFSSENLNKPNTQTTDSSQTDRHNAGRPFGSASDLKGSGCTPVDSPTRNATGQPGLNVNAEESNICTCSGVRNIMTRPLSPQRKAEEFKTYLANIQTLQNASNVLKQHDLIKLNYIFDNSYASASSDRPLPEVLPIVLGVDPSSANSFKETGTPSSTASGGLTTTSEDSEVATRYEEAVRDLSALKIDLDEQRRIFCDLHKEFWDLPLNHQEKPLVFGSQTKNRYKTILPNETTRVMLQKESIPTKNLDASIKRTGEVEKEGVDSEEQISSNIVGNKLLIASAETPYINANYIKGPDTTTFSYVATQGPLPNTIFEFWLMVYQNVRKQNSVNVDNLIPKLNMPRKQYYQKIVMLTNFQENHRQKCVAYFPVELNEIFIGSSKQEVVQNNDILNAFFDNYLQTSEFHPTGSEDAIEIFEVEELDDEVSKSLLQTGNSFVLKNIGIVRKNGFSIRKMAVLYCQISPPMNPKQIAGCVEISSSLMLPRLLIQRFFCYHYWYPDWPDHRSPRDINTLLDISLHILNLGKCEAEFDSCSLTPGSHIDSQAIDFYQQDLFNILQPLPIIHCSAGVGRTGCLSAILNGIRQMRQALAYSLTSMAADLSSEPDTKSEQPLSPIDFRMPCEFYSEFIHSDLSLESNNDTDSSFTRNTLLYINYITEQHKAKRTAAVGSDSTASETTPSRKIPNLTNLPRMPDILVDILGIVCNLRLSRGGMVQNSEQYELIHRALCLYLKRTLALKRF